MIGWMLTAFTIFAAYAHFQYTPALQKYFWIAAPVLALSAHILWIVWCKRMESPSEMYVNAFWYWQVATQASVVVLPVLAYNVRLQPLGWVGVVLATAGIVCLYLGTKG